MTMKADSVISSPINEEVGASHGEVVLAERHRLICEQVMSLPMHPYLKDDETKRIADAVRDALA